MSILRAKTSFIVSERRFVRQGDIVHSNDPIVKGRDGLFDVLDPEDPAPVRKAVKKAAPKSDG